MQEDPYGASVKLSRDVNAISFFAADALHMPYG